MSDRIRVRAWSRDELMDLRGGPLEEMADEGVIISIRDSRGKGPDPIEEECLLRHPNVLVVAFDDIDKPLPGREEFTPRLAGSVARFIRERRQPGMEVHVQCTYGSSRSGAIAEAVNLHLNETHDLKGFYRDNPHIQPNPLVRTLMAEALGLDKGLVDRVVAGAPYNTMDPEDIE